MGIEREKHSLNRRLGRFFVVDLARVFLFDGSDRFAVIAFNALSFEFFGRGLVRFCDATMRARTQTSGYARNENDENYDGNEVPIHTCLSVGRSDEYLRMKYSTAAAAELKPLRHACTKALLYGEWRLELSNVSVALRHCASV